MSLQAAQTKKLIAGAKDLNQELNQLQVEKLVRYLELLRKWNETYNLTAITEPSRVISHHILDSLSIAPYLRGSRLLDLGSGAGLPGLPLAILFADKRFILLDSSGKKTRFLHQVCMDLELSNIEVVNERAERFSQQTFDSVLVRALGSLKKIALTAAHLLAENGVILAMKGELTKLELSEVPENIKVHGIHTLLVPGVSGNRNLVTLTK